MATPVVYYVTDAGRCPFKEFLDALPEKQAAQIVADLHVLGRDGVRHAPISKRPIKGRSPMWELRIGGYRVLFVEAAGKIVILAGCKKGDQDAAIKAAAKRMDALRER